jgi:hypothetical protein
LTPCLKGSVLGLQAHPFGLQLFQLVLPRGERLLPPFAGQEATVAGQGVHPEVEDEQGEYVDSNQYEYTEEF